MGILCHCLIFAVLKICRPNLVSATTSQQGHSSTFVSTAPTYLTLVMKAQEITNEDFEFKTVNLAKPLTYVVQAISHYPSSQAYHVTLKPVNEAPLAAFIVHLSGSTGFPKPVCVAHQSTCFNIATASLPSPSTTITAIHASGAPPTHARYSGSSRRQIFLSPLCTPFFVLPSLFSH
jgi:long-subunit acyl-CoA synthetase (AMP-forming)